MTKNQQNDTMTKAVTSMLDMAADKGWAQVTLQGVARAAGLSLSDLRELTGGRAGLLAEFGKMIDTRALAQAGSMDDAMPFRDRLFELLMARFDVLNEHRAGTLAVLKGCALSPGYAASVLPHLGQSMAWMLDAAGEPTHRCKGIKIGAITIVYLMTLKEWISDESEDMSVTMAALDKNLGRAERWAATFRFNQGVASASSH